VLRVYNRVTDGPYGMREDVSPVQLTRQPRPYCQIAGCIAGTARTTGQVYEYGVELTNGTEGYVSDVWVIPSQRAAKLSLPPCPANFGKT
jgi:hypothetical protein